MEDLIPRPRGTRRHLAHASDAEQAEEILLRWRIDGKGKLAGTLEAGLLQESFRPALTRMPYGVEQNQSGFGRSRSRLVLELEIEPSLKCR